MAKRNNNIEQLDLFGFSENYKITKPIRLIEFFAGIGAQAKALDILGVPYESWKICEWAIPSIKAYNQIHANKKEDLKLSKIDLIECVMGVSKNYNEPCTREQLEKMSEEELQEISNCILNTNNLVDISSVCGDDLDIVDTDKYTYLLTYSFPCQDLSLAGKHAGLEEGSGTRSSLLWQVGRILEECKEKPDCLIMENVPQIVGKDALSSFLIWCKQLEDMGYSNYWKILNARDYGLPQSRTRCFMVSIHDKEAVYSFPHKMRLEYKLKDFLDKNVDEKYYVSDQMLEGMRNTSFESYKLENKLLDNKEVANCIIARFDGAPQCVSVGNKPRYSQKSLERISKNIVDETSKVVGTITASGMQSINHQNCHLIKSTEPTLVGGFGEKKSNGGTQWFQQDRVYDGENIAMCHPANIPGGSYKYLDSNSKIRKLTPKECLKLMGFEASDYYKLAQIQTDGQIYHEAGDSICTTCLIAIIGKLLGMDYTKIIKDYVLKLVKE